MDIPNVEFTYEWYEKLLSYLDQNNYAFLDYSSDMENKSVILRHDVDWSPRKAVKLARIESEMSIYSTYFFLLTSPFYNVLNKETREMISEISGMGHNIGLHFSTHQYWVDNPGDNKIEDMVKQEVSILSSTTEEDIKTVSFHNPPHWVFKKEYRGFISTYEPRFFNEIEYTADSNQRWRENHPFEKELPKKLQILVHPVLWNTDDGDVTKRLTDEQDYVFDKIDEFMKSENDIY